MTSHDFKVAVINNEGIKILGKLDDEDFHVHLLRKYTLEKYPESEIAPHVPNLEASYLAACLCYLHNDIVLLNTTSNSSFKSLLICMKEDISEEQREKLDAFLDGYDDYDVEIIDKAEDKTLYSKEFNHYSDKDIHVGIDKHVKKEIKRKTR